MSYGRLFLATKFIQSYVCFWGIWILYYGYFPFADLYDIWYFSIWGFDSSGFFGSRFFRHMHMGPGPFKVGVSLICLGILDPFLWILPGYGSLWKLIYLYLRCWRARIFWIQIFSTDICGSRILQSWRIHNSTHFHVGPGPTYMCQKNLDPKNPGSSTPQI